jgi:hypothetical protein
MTALNTNFIPLITKFKSTSTLYDSLGSPNSSYISMISDKNHICLLKDVTGNIVVYNTTTENVTSFKIYYPYNIYSILKYENVIYGFAGYDAKPFVEDTVLYVKDNNKLVQESYNKVAYVVHLSSSTEIRDFMIDDDYNYYVIHNKNNISKFSKDRIRSYTFSVTPAVSSVFNSLSVMPNDEIELLKIDYVREYTNNGLSSYPIVLGKIKNGTGNNLLAPSQMFLGKIDESSNTVYEASFLPLTAEYYLYGDIRRINYNLTNYEYLKNTYKSENQLTFKVVLQNVYDNRDIIRLEIPISTYLFKTEKHHFAFRMDGINGMVSVLLDGKEIQTVNIQKGRYIFQDIFTDSMNVGRTYFNNNISLTNYLNQPNYYYANNATLKRFKIFNKALTNNQIEFEMLNGIDMQDLVVSLPCDQRNELDGIERQFKLDTTGNKSNKINLIIKNSQITNTILQNRMKDIISEKLKKVLPITTTINNIEFR